MQIICPSGLLLVQGSPGCFSRSCQSSSRCSSISSIPGHGFAATVLAPKKAPYGNGQEEINKVNKGSDHKGRRRIPTAVDAHADQIEGLLPGSFPVGQDSARWKNEPLALEPIRDFFLLAPAVLTAGSLALDVRGKAVQHVLLLKIDATAFSAPLLA